ncbi:hypothetical protein FZ934_20875 (plasmid) [Rhizobium grahamii]|uniref:MBL fold metallo-hydrolase n=1 Tax=Rhizobium grahamii TaxID=1120045 RepID=A0A5Q0CFB4_9HYPH|nr:MULTISPECIES: hypothetical protein [Rhizobium]QFY62810.1 hypothetical protein FZ934_20875 [Rhizobium grahamii]QRM52443.1 hypothetical protein F3Y33_24780 [Rhizobium sp. BG6]
MTGQVVLHLLPAEDGDCLLVEAKSDGDEVAIILIDGGRGRTYSNWKPYLDKVLGPRRTIDLLVVTHIDEDHIDGVLKFLGDEARDIAVSEVWFNGHLQVSRSLSKQELEAYSVSQADDLSEALSKSRIPWNSQFGGGPIHREALNGGTVAIGPFTLSLLTPSRRKLSALAGVWPAVLQELKADNSDDDPEGLEGFGVGLDIDELAASPDSNDTSRPNGSSIGFLLEAFGRKLLLVGDCHPNDLWDGLIQIGAKVTAPLSVDIMKVSHHGAAKNTTRKLLSLVRAEAYGFSTDGSAHPHPDATVVAKIIKSSASPKLLAFNYRTDLSKVWDDPELKECRKFETRFPDEDAPGYLKLVLPPRET